MNQPTIPNPVLNMHGDLHFAASDGQLYVNRSFGGGYHLHTRADHGNRTTGISITTAELAAIAAALAQIAAADKR